MSYSPAQEDRKFVTAMARGLQVLKAFTRSDPWLSNQEIAARTGLPRSTVTRATYTLVENQFLEIDPATQTYRLGSAVVQLASQLAAWESIRRMLRPQLVQLALATDVAIGVAHLDGCEMAYFEYVRPASPVILSLDVGSRVPVIGTAAGLSLMASLDTEELVYLKSRVAATEDLQRSFDEQAHAARDQFARLGYCTAFGCWRREVNAIAAPLYVPAAATNIVVTAAGPAMTFTEERLSREIAPEFLRSMTALRQKASGLI